jgi:hypothetical protein
VGAVGDEEIRKAPPSIGPTRLRRQTSEPDWLCDGAFRDEHGRTWLCGRIKHGGTAHQAWLYIDADGQAHEVTNDCRLEWRDW